MDITRLTTRRGFLLTLISIFILFLFFTLPSGNGSVGLDSTVHGKNGEVEGWCPILPKPAIVDDGMKPSFLLNDRSVAEKQVRRLKEAINIPTISYANWGHVEKDERFESFHRFHDLLDKLFPIVHEDLELTMVNHLGLLYKFQGRDKSLKPILLSAHQDVLPADSPMEWTHPPFNAHYDGDFIWGRGSTSKTTLIGLLSVLERLLEQNFMPKRTILLAFGFDEEIGGKKGAELIARELGKMYGNDGIAMIVDEGGMGIEAKGNHVYALPAVAEKGYMDVKVEMDVKGGHSSNPPAHSGIGIMSEMIVALENNPYPSKLAKENPFRRYLECQVRHSPREIEGWLRDSLLEGSSKSEIDIGRGLSSSRGANAKLSMQTSQSVDVINAGNATKQLPQEITTVINYRIAPHDSLDSIKSRILEILEPIAKKHDIAIKGFGSKPKTLVGAQVVTLSSIDDLAPSPVTPTDPSSKVWNIFAGTIRSVYEDTSSFKGKTVVPVGSIMIENTESIHYWNLSKNIFRFTPARVGTLVGVHGVDERVDMNAHIEGMRWYYDLIRNLDRADL